jgi:hypothetical protein
MKIISRPGAEGQIVTDAGALRAEVARLRGELEKAVWMLKERNSLGAKLKEVLRAMAYIRDGKVPDGLDVQCYADWVIKSSTELI